MVVRFGHFEGNLEDFGHFVEDFGDFDHFQSHFSLFGHCLMSYPCPMVILVRY